MRISDKAIDRIYVERFLRDTSFQMPEYHYHPYYEIYYVDRGSVNVFIQNAMIVLSTGDFIIIPPKVLHHMRYNGSSPVLRTNIFFRKEDLSEQISSVVNLGEAENDIQIYQIPIRYRENVAWRFNELLEETELPDKYSISLLKIKTEELLIFISRNCQKLNDISLLLHTTDNEIIKASEYIANHFRENVTLNSVAKEVGLSPNYLSSKFREIAGLGLHEYLTFVRLEEAASLLVNSKLSITEVALECGFSSGNYFNSAFKKTYGVTPREYRNTYTFV